jgi:hypothetical protein
MMTNLDQQLWPIRRASLVYPSPVAIASGRVLRARTAAERVNAVLKAAEVLARYLAAVAAASFATRTDEGTAKLTALQGNLSFGHFLTVVQEAAGVTIAHPVTPLLAQGFKSKRQNKETVRGKTDAALVELLELRNELGHELRNLDEAKAAALEAKSDPRKTLAAALDGSDTLLSKPLFVVEQQEWSVDGVVMRHLLLMGESADPAPHRVKLKDGGVEFKQEPYVAINETCLHLPPWLLWGIDLQRQNFSLLLLDGVDGSKLRYCTIDGSEQHRESPDLELVRLNEFHAGTKRQARSVVLFDGRSLAREWSDERKRIEEAAHHHAGTIDWAALNQSTLAWYAKQLSAEGGEAYWLIQERLLDGRTSFKADELRQLKLLFGTPAAVRAELQRDVLDIRVIDPASGRSSTRELVEADNLVEALKRATLFFAAQRGLADFAPEKLKISTGSVDYLTLREVLVNQIVHQDYSDATTAAQIELNDEKVTVFNAGASLVPMEHLLDGGKSQSRNPLIARALRSVGFAEISGSGIRAVHRACQQAQRKSPTFESNDRSNTFTLTLDWSAPTPEDVDSYWNSLLGVRLMPLRAKVLNALSKLPSATLSVLEKETGLSVEQLESSLEFLVLQGLIEQDESNYRLAPHIRERLG